MRKNQFIGDFVNAVYAIILGFGFTDIIASIISGGIQFDSTLLFQLLMALFVIIVVCFYWWDWSENIKNRVESTFVEFVIDLSILFTLQMILFEFDDPFTLVKLFFSLSFLNLVWTINFLRDSGKVREHQKDCLGWIGQKVLALFLYGLAWYSVLQIPYDGEEVKLKFLALIPIIVAFSLVRLLCFKERPLDIKLRAATSP